MTTTNVNIIRAFQGPRHSKLERIWQYYRQRHDINLHVYDNPEALLNHGQALQRMWEKERRRSEQFAIFTEFDFLPGPAFLEVRPPVDVLAAQYCTRDPGTKRIEGYPWPGAWFVVVDKDRVKGELDFTAGGPFNDAANDLKADLLETTDCYPDHYGVLVRLGERLVGTHLFWSRHYNNAPFVEVAGFPLKPILDGVDRTICRYVQEDLD